MAALDMFLNVLPALLHVVLYSQGEFDLHRLR